MAKAQPAGLCEHSIVLFEPTPELRFFRLARSGHILREEPQLLRHSAFDDRIVLLQAHRQRLAVEDLFLHLIFHQPGELLRCGVAPPLRLEQHHHLAEIVEG